MSEALRLLLVDDDEVDRMAMRRAVAEADGVELAELADGGGLVDRLRDDRIDCLVLDLHLPGRSGIDLVREVRAAGLSTPVVILTGRQDAVIADAIAAGATDFMHKGELSPVRVMERVRHAVRLARAEAASAELAAAREAELGTLRRALRTRDQLLDLAGHDLRNPLHSMAIALSELANGGLAEDVRAQYVAAARRSVEKMERLVRDVLDLGHLESGNLRFDPQPTAVAWLLEQVEREHGEAARAARMPLEVEVASDAGKVLVDPARTQQLLGKLIANSLKHARGSGPVTVRASGAGGAVEIRVADRGPGFAADLLPALFDRDAEGTGKRRGPGLGLALAHGLTVGQGGSIAAANRDDKGAEVRVRLPRAE